MWNIGEGRLRDYIIMLEPIGLGEGGVCVGGREYDIQPDSNYHCCSSLQGLRELPLNHPSPSLAVL